MIWHKSDVSLTEEKAVLPKLNTMKKFILSLCAQLILIAAFAQTDYGALTMTITEKGNKLPIPFANVVVKDSNGKMVTGAQTDFDGMVDIRPIPKGVYTVEILSLGFKTVTIKGVKISASETSTIPSIETQMEMDSEQIELVRSAELESINVRTCRGGEYYYIDGIKVQGSNTSAIDIKAESPMIMGGLSAQYANGNAPATDF